MFVQCFANVGIKALAEGPSVTCYQMCFAAQSPQNTGQFDGNVTRTDHHHHFRAFFQGKKSIGINGMFGDSVSWWYGRTSPDGNQDLGGRNGLGRTVLLCNRYGVFIDKRRIANVHIDIQFFQSIFVNTIQSFNVLVTFLFQHTPIDLWIVGSSISAFESILLGFFTKCRGNTGGRVHDFFRDTTDIDTGTTPTSSFQNRHLDIPRCRRTFGTGNATTATSQHDVIVII
mmetsp:Transcript_30283/g.45875  ORF Transcript_30283/g.45875 Transcript_30283/m.45875 type:complete len:229 (+) Transcript_30283:981-1667(+)